MFKRVGGGEVEGTLGVTEEGGAEMGSAEGAWKRKRRWNRRTTGGEQAGWRTRAGADCPKLKRTRRQETYRPSRRISRGF